MKKNIILLSIVILLTGLELNAQVFVGGSLRYDTQTNSSVEGTTTTDGGTTSKFNFAPEIGTFLGENFALGLRVSFDAYGEAYSETNNTYSSTGTITGTTSTKYDNNSNYWVASPFVRYYIIKKGDFSLFGEGVVSIGGLSYDETAGTTTNKGPGISTFGFSLAPGISYDISEKISLTARFNGLSYTKTTITDGSKSKADQSSYAAIIHLMDIGKLTFGLNVKF